MGTLFSVWTVLVGVVFLGVVAWVLSRKRNAEFEAAARIPLEDDDDAPRADGNGD
ncbi:MAG: CcoQ/FixQ family Cbb3-type cytochrome c oxidase assembly chaperone [Gammaproteobacteria bacterium]